MPLGSGSSLGQIIHPRLHGDLELIFPSVVTIEKSNEAQAGDFSVVNVWVVFLSGLKGSLAPLKEWEKRRRDMTITNATHALNIAGYYPQIELGHRAKVLRGVGDGVEQVFNITAVQSDSQAQSTRLELEVASA